MAQAQRFVLTQDAVDAIVNVCQSKPSSIISSISAVRPPHNLMWIEFAQADRIAGWKRFRAEDWRYKPRTGTGVENRIGALISADPAHKNLRFTACYAWDFAPGHEDAVMAVGCSTGMHAFDMQPTANLDSDPVIQRMRAFSPARTVEELRTMIERDHDWTRLDDLNYSLKWARLDDPVEAAARLELEQRIAVLRSPHTAQQWKMIITAGLANLEAARRVVGMWMGDIAPEALFTCAALLLINSRNVVEREPVDMSRLNKSRARNNKPPLLDHHVVKLAPRLVHRRRAAAQGYGRDVREHLVRGHFKLRASGVYWWSPHLRGRAEAGRVTHEYEVGGQKST